MGAVLGHHRTRLGKVEHLSGAVAFVMALVSAIPHRLHACGK